jgi:hypothetical protein
MSAEQYLTLGVETNEATREHKKADSPIDSIYLPEINETVILGDDNATYF